MKIIKSMLPVSILNIIALFLMIQRLPATIAVHFTFGMQADRFADKWVLFALSFLPVIVSIILLIYLNTIESKEMMMSRKTENILVSALVTFLIFITWLPVYFAFQHHMEARIPIDLAIFFPTGVLLSVVGILLGSIKYNKNYRYTGVLVGIRLPWVLKNEIIWEKSHKFGGYRQ